MIAAFLMLAAAAPSVAAPTPTGKTSLFLKCAAEGSEAGKAHQLDLVFFDPKPTWAHGFNFFDPDKLLPAGVIPTVTNQWPSLLQIELDTTVGGNSALIQLARESGPLPTARLNIAVINAAGQAQPGYHGRCNLSEGAIAENEFRGLSK